MENNRFRKLIAPLIFGVVLCGVAAASGYSADRTRDLTIGTIKNVRCRGRRLDMDVKNQQGTMHLFTANYFKMDFTAENFKPKGKLDPCKEITGMKATAVFYDVPRRPDQGELISVQLSKPESQ
jgi:hypothetical protein